MKKLLALFLLSCSAGWAQNYDAEWYYNQGCAYARAGNYGQAIPYLKKANELAGGNEIVCLYAIGSCYFDMENYALSGLWYKQAAELGDDYSQVNLGYQYYEGKGVSKDYSKAVYWFRKAAEKGNEIAYENLGECYYYGRGVPKDMSQAKYWYAKAGKSDLVAKCEQEIAQSGETQDAQWYLDKGNEYYKAENYDTAITYYKKANELAGGNNATCQFNTGQCYNRKKEYTQAVYWFRKAAEQGYADAQFNLGFCYATGNGIPEDQAHAFYWYQKAALQGEASAQDETGRRYAAGKGVEEDKGMAVFWYRKAAEQGHGNSMIRLGLSYYYGQGVPEDKSLAKYWMKKGLESNPTITILISLAEALTDDKKTQE